MGRRAKRCRWRRSAIYRCTGGKFCQVWWGRHQTEREYQRVMRVAEHRHSGRHDWATVATEGPF